MPPVRPRPTMPLADVDIDRASELRVDPDFMGQARTVDTSRFLVIADGQLLVSEAGRLVWFGPQVLSLRPQRELFLGLDSDGHALFGLGFPPGWSPRGTPIEGLGELSDFRAATGVLSPFEASCAATARALFEWHRRHGYCANCGQPSETADAGWKRTCPACGAEHFPRTDPVAIMLAVSDDRALLGRQSSWPRGFWSCLAGFIEPGESIEQGAARELKEEAGIETDPAGADYLFSQPWPFPSSLMIGLVLPALTDTITVNTAEIEDARWFSREDVVAIIEGRHPDAYCPPPTAIAYHIMRAWAFGET